ncbi:MAG: hypothetical protein ABIH67_03175 [Candidatus Uhrbacteria bacterium]
MNIPNLPTDNLYKFIALVGVVVLLAASYFPIIKARELRLAMIEIEGKIKSLEIEVQYLQDINKKLEPNESTGDRNKEELLDKAYKLKMKNEELRTNSKKVEVIGIDYECIRKIQTYGMIFGFILSAFGFFLWYFKIQKYQDKQLKKNS